MPSLAELEYAYLGGLGATRPSLADRRLQIYGASHHAYFAALSGLTPAAKYSLTDHKRVAFGATSGQSLADAARVFWSGGLPPALYPDTGLFPATNLYPMG